MGITKTFFFVVNFLAVSSICLAQATIFHDIAQGNKKAVKVWLKSKPDLSIMNEQGQTVLHVAVMTGDWSMVKTVLKSKIAINVLDKQGKTALDCAVDQSDVKMVQKLFNRKAQVTTQQNAEYVANVTKFYFPRAVKLAMIISGILVAAVICYELGIGCLIAGACSVTGVQHLL